MKPVTNTAKRVLSLIMALAMILTLLPGAALHAHAASCYDDDGDHYCDHCDEWLTDCEDADEDHCCDICDDWISDCVDDDGDGWCDFANCEEYIGEC